MRVASLLTLLGLGATVSGCECQDPTAEQCLSREWLNSSCGQAEVTRWEAALSGGEAEQASICAELVDDETPGYDEVPAVGPGQAGVPDRVVVVREQPYGREGHRYHGATGRYRTHRTTAWTRKSSTAPGAEAGGDPLAAESRWQAIRDAWSANGERVESCREYVYERFYSHSVFEDAVIDAGDDYWRFFDVAFGAGDGAIGSQALSGQLQRARDGSIIEPQVRFSGEPQAPHALFTYRPLEPGTREDVAEAVGRVDIFRNQPGGINRPEGNCGSSLRGPALCDDELWETMRQAADEPIIWSWAEHRAMGLALREAGVLPETFERADHVVSEFERLVHRRERIVGILREHQRQARLNDLDDRLRALRDELILTEEDLFPTPARDPISRHLDTEARRRGDLLDTSRMGHIVREGFDDAVAEMPEVDEIPPQVAPVDEFDNRDFRPLESARPSQRLEPALAGTYQERLMQIDARLEALLHEADALGCFSPDGVSPCHWSPRRFAEQVDSLYESHREAEYQRCLDNTPDGFDLTGHSFDWKLNEHSERQWSRITVDGETVHCSLDREGNFRTANKRCRGCDDWARSTERVSQFFDCKVAFHQMKVDAVVSRLSTLGLLEGGRVKTRQTESERHHVGNDDVNVTLEYGFGWAIEGLEDIARAPELEDGMDLDSYCELDPELYGYARLDAGMVGVTYPVLRASAHARAREAGMALPDGVEPDRVELSVFGVEIFGRDLDEAFDIVRETHVLERELAAGATTFTIGPVPVTVTFGLAGRVGLSYELNARLMDLRDAGDLECSVLFGLYGRIEPTAGLDGFATAGVGVPGLQAGVKGEMDLLALAVPFEADLELLPGPQLAPFDLQLSMAADLDIIASFLSGRLSLFAEVWPATWQRTILAWNGPRLRHGLFDASLRVSLSDIVEVTRVLLD